MARHVWEIEINADTSREDLERCIFEAVHDSDSNIIRAASNARAELARRDREEWADRFAAQERARVQAQVFQASQTDRQLKVANKQLLSGSVSAAAAFLAAIAAIALAVIAFKNLP